MAVECESRSPSLDLLRNGNNAIPNSGDWSSHDSGLQLKENEMGKVDMRSSEAKAAIDERTWRARVSQVCFNFFAAYRLLYMQLWWHNMNAFLLSLRRIFISSRACWRSVRQIR
jgi:hypothetical protein